MYICLVTAVGWCSGQYIGARIGALSRLQHEVQGEVYAVDSRTLHIKGFSYDGAAPGTAIVVVLCQLSRERG